LQRNNESLDYVQYVEFFLTKRDHPKAIPASLRAGQRAKIWVRRSELIRLPGAPSDCVLPDLGNLEDAVDVSIDGFSVRKLPIMTDAGDRGRIELSKAWWTANLQKVNEHPSISSGAISSIRISKTSALDKEMKEGKEGCAALKVEVIVEVFKQDLRGPT
jgi:hypothetical protein